MNPGCFILFFAFGIPRNEGLEKGGEWRRFGWGWREGGFDFGEVVGSGWEGSLGKMV